MNTKPSMGRLGNGCPTTRAGLSLALSDQCKVVLQGNRVRAFRFRQIEVLAVFLLHGNRSNRVVLLDRNNTLSKLPSLRTAFVAGMLLTIISLYNNRVRKRLAIIWKTFANCLSCRCRCNLFGETGRCDSTAGHNDRNCDRNNALKTDNKAFHHSPRR